MSVHGKKGILVMILYLSLSMSACGTGRPVQEIDDSNAEQETENSEQIQMVESNMETEEGRNLTVKSGIVTTKEELAFPLGQQVNAGSFTGTVYIEPMIAKDDVYHFPSTNHVTFEPGARSSWHRHGGMVILVTGGIGYYQEEGQPAQILRTGDVVECTPGVRHWHGAAPDSWFSQMVIWDSDYTPESGEALEEDPVTDEYYENLETEESQGRTTTEGSDFIFRRNMEPVEYDTFSGPVYVSSILGSGNAAGAPELHYVVFEPGVINNWHTHEGGQILIATDGIGYHQIEGEPVQVLHPGDVALCPPGVKHWHGGSADTEFAH